MYVYTLIGTVLYDGVIQCNAAYTYSTDGELDDKWLIEYYRGESWQKWLRFNDGDSKLFTVHIHTISVLRVVKLKG